MCLRTIPVRGCVGVILQGLVFRNPQSIREAPSQTLEYTGVRGPGGPSVGIDVEQRDAPDLVQKYPTSSPARSYLARHGIVPVITRRYAPVMTPEIIEFLGEKDRTSRFQTLLRKTAGGVLPRHFNPIWKYLYYSNVAVLCRHAQSNRS